jgi:hypothetical protein
VEIIKSKAIVPRAPSSSSSYDGEGVNSDFGKDQAAKEEMLGRGRKGKCSRGTRRGNDTRENNGSSSGGSSNDVCVWDQVNSLSSIEVELRDRRGGEEEVVEMELDEDNNSDSSSNSNNDDEGEGEKDEDIELQENEKDKMNSSGEPGKREKKNKKKVYFKSALEIRLTLLQPCKFEGY